MIRVSVVVPVYNGAARVEGAVARLLAQTTPAHEIVLVDDGSTDASAEVITELADRHPNVVPLLRPRNEGVLRAREAGVRHATGDAVWFVDDDDAWSPDAIGDLTSQLRDGVDVVVGGARYLDAAGATVKELAPPRWRGVLGADAALGMLLEGAITGHLWNKLFRRAVLLEMPYAGATVHSDLAMVAAALSRSVGIGRTDSVVYDYHPRPGSIIGSRRPRYDSLLSVDAAIDEALTHRAPDLRGSDAHLYFRSRFVWLSALKDAVQADHPDHRRREIVARARAELGPDALRVLARRRDGRRLALAASAKVSLRGYRAILSRTSDGRTRARPASEAGASAAPPVAGAAAVQVFCVGRGQFENIGDAILRRPLIDWAREAGTPHVYVGQSPPGYDEALGVRAGDVSYRSYSQWYRAALRAAWLGPAAYLFKPGELQLSLGGLKEHIAVLPLLVVLRLRRGRVVRVGSGARNFATLPRLLMRPSIALSDLVLWRDPRSAAYFGGGVMPDLAFAEGADDDELDRRRAGGARDVLVVSMRPRDDSGPRPYPRAEWIDAVRGFARRRGLEVWAVAQVQQDSDRARRLAADLGGRVLDWPEATDHARQERRLRQLYARSAIAVSDRLHVLIAAFTEGAVPFASLTVESDKIDRHFRAIGISGVATVAAHPSRVMVEQALGSALGREHEFFARLRAARRELAGIRRGVVAILAASGTRRRRGSIARPPASARPVVYHLGRAGEVAGGMTQVLNSYLAAPFPRVDVRVLTSRGDPGDIAAGLRGFVGTARALWRMPRSAPISVVAHLSTGGSFLREGALLRLAAHRGLGTIAHIHGSTFAAFAARHPRSVRRVLARADLVISLSDEITAVCRTMVAPARVVLVPNAVAPGHPRPSSDTVVFGGAVGHRKGVDLLLEAWAALQPTSWNLVIAGPGADEAMVRDAPSGVTFAGSLPHAELMDLLDGARIAVLPSRGEALPMFVLEAMARDVCVVASDVGGIPEVLADGCGMVVPAGDAAALREALGRATADEELRERTAAAARARFEAVYSTEAVFPRLEAVWMSVMRHTPGRDESGERR